MHKKSYPSTFILKANIQKPIFIIFLERKLISTGFYLKFSKNIKKDFFIKKKFIDTGTICIIHISDKKKEIEKGDNQYYKELKVIIINISLKNILIQPNEKIAIMDVYPEIEIKWKKCSILNKSKRGNNSFGSTGI
ncbi:deoxyuridine 5'-triphosphate nucleotidohydrolase [Blattabacterium sp. (Cryptocercus kyebangensis)]|uniref:deoxyuridine 5'-triphosphate nucleotidohydrolase n=1 Tax=Blattabacterium sp. (Cryptocercus kyebangensis) TaxID=298656 RepID=UPI000D7BCDF9|nr:deoxyuridine 5'-triphosphate nucleotidohydrolase [Blattabacterium sp. (Cryptocercus kyebangensis)]AWU43969.1 deoxyuridine 5'-triphosphate nucleotidohydrolase [Blattabacterium sp. (Cryptocercus kyebangensis)]